MTNNNKLPLFQGSFPQVQCRRTLAGPLSSIVRIMRTARKSLIFLQPQAQTANNFKYTGARGTPANNTYIRRQEETASAGPYEERVHANGSTCVRCSIDSANNRFLRITINCQHFSRCCLGKEKIKQKHLHTPRDYKSLLRRRKLRRAKVIAYCLPTQQPQ